MFPECRVCGIRHDPRQPTCNLDDRIAHARKKAGLQPLIPVNEAANKPAQPIVNSLALNERQVVHKVVHKVVHESKHGKYADAEKRKAYRAEWYRQKRKADKQKAQA